MARLIARRFRMIRVARRNSASTEKRFAEFDKENFKKVRAVGAVYDRTSSLIPGKVSWPWRATPEDEKISQSRTESPESRARREMTVRFLVETTPIGKVDRKSTRLNS